MFGYNYTKVYNALDIGTTKEFIQSIKHSLVYTEVFGEPLAMDRL